MHTNLFLVYVSLYFFNFSTFNTLNFYFQSRQIHAYKDQIQKSANLQELKGNTTLKGSKLKKYNFIKIKNGKKHYNNQNVPQF